MINRSMAPSANGFEVYIGRELQRGDVLIADNDAKFEVVQPRVTAEKRASGFFKGFILGGTESAECVEVVEHIEGIGNTPRTKFFRRDSNVFRTMVKVEDRK